MLKRVRLYPDHWKTNNFFPYLAYLKSPCHFWLGNPGSPEQELYSVGMTRSKERLLITASGRNEFTERLRSMTGAVCAVA